MIQWQFDYCERVTKSTGFSPFSEDEIFKNFQDNSLGNMKKIFFRESITWKITSIVFKKKSTVSICVNYHNTKDIPGISRDNY